MPSIEMLQNLLGRSSREAADAALRSEIAQEQAADAIWCFVVQREVMGLRDRARIVADYQIPREVMVRLGAR